MKKLISLLVIYILIAATHKGSFPNLAPIQDNSFTDIDGNRYDVVQIGEQFWMKQNLNTSHYRNGDPIPQVTSLKWATLTTGAWCYFVNKTENGVTYGKLYNWYAVNDPRGLAPTGWHIPSYGEWTLLENTLGGSSVTGGKMKEKGRTHWRTPNNKATDKSGFTGLPGGCRGEDGNFYDGEGRLGGWWSSTEYSSIDAYKCLLGFSSSHLSRGSFRKSVGLSVRCIKD